MSWDDINDANVALFLRDAGIRSLFHVGCQKTYYAALRSQFQNLCLPNSSSFPDKYPLIS